MASRIAIDIGGTFTDIAILEDDGAVHTFKVSTNAAEPAAAVAAALEGLATWESDWEYALHATTVGTNAILERKLPKVLLITTKGFRDILEIRRTKRASLFNVSWSPPDPLVTRDRIYEVDERMSPDGEVWSPLPDSELSSVDQWIRFEKPTSVAICLLHSYANDAHEQRIAKHLRAEFPNLFVTASSEVARERGEYERTSTTVVHAALRPVMSNYLDEMELVVDTASGTRLLVMQSNGGLATSRQIAEAPGNAVESGPAAGALFAGEVARQMGIEEAVAFDMGGTTAKACLLEHGSPSEQSELRVGGEMHSGEGFRETSGYVIRGKSIALVEVGAGGGSLCRVDEQGVLHVGPQSAGAFPGPAAYGRGGEIPTVTDADLVLGFLAEGDASDVVLDKSQARDAIKKCVADPLGVSVEEAAWLIFDVANSNMIRAIHAVTTERGRDPSRQTLIAFGGGGPTHASAIASELGMSALTVPYWADCFSAVGLHTCSVRRDLQEPVGGGLGDISVDEISARFQALVDRATSELNADGLTDLRFTRLFDLRFVGQMSSLTIAAPPFDGDLPARLRQEFISAYLEEHGHADEHAPLELVAILLRVEAPLPEPYPRASKNQSVGKRTRAEVYFGPDLGWLIVERVPVGELSQDVPLDGPALITLGQATLVVPPKASAALDALGNIKVTLEPSAKGTTSRGAWSDRAGLELFRNRLGAVLDRMAFTLVRTAYSGLIAEAHDFAVAIADEDGSVIDQGVGVGMHLGTVPVAMDAIRASALWPLAPGDIVLMNDPYNGGTHLPDCFVISPVAIGGEVVGHTIAVAHMIDIGGATASSWSTGRTELIQEGLVLPPVKLFENGRQNDAVVDIIRRNLRHPVEFIGDLHGLVSAVKSGAMHLVEQIEDVGLDRVRSTMKELIEYASDRGRAEIRAIGTGSASFTDHLDSDGETNDDPVDLKVNLRVEGGEVWADFSGTSPQRPAGINATISIPMTVVQYCIRCLMSEDFPDNAGLHRLIHISAPPGTVVSATDDAPVSNRGLTAFRLVDAVFGAMATMFPGRVPAAYDGSIGPVTITGRTKEGRRFSLVDLFGGTNGASPWADGVEGLKSALGNGRNMPIEHVEATMPIKFLTYGFAAGTGGRGEYRGGNGILRAWEMLNESAEVMVRVDRIKFRPWGLAGGEPGAPNQTRVVRADGSVIPITRRQVLTMHRGDRLFFQGPGGGGYGNPELRSAERRERDAREGRTTG